MLAARLLRYPKRDPARLPSGSWWGRHSRACRINFTLSQKHARYLSHKASVIFTFVNNYTFPYSQQSLGSSVMGFAFSLMCHMKHKFSTRLLSWLTNMFNFTVLVLPPRRAPFKTHSRWARRRTRWSRASLSISLQSRALRYFPLITEGFCWCGFTPFPPLLVRRIYIDAWVKLRRPQKAVKRGTRQQACMSSQSDFIYLLIHSAATESDAWDRMMGSRFGWIPAPGVWNL